MIDELSKGADETQIVKLLIGKKFKFVKKAKDALMFVGPFLDATAIVAIGMKAGGLERLDILFQGEAPSALQTVADFSTRYGEPSRAVPTKKGGGRIIEWGNKDIDLMIDGAGQLFTIRKFAIGT